MLAVGRALMSGPRLLLVDEVSLGLAPIVVSSLFAALEEVNRQGTAILLVEQFVHFALKHTSRAYVLGKGEVVIEGKSSELLASPELMAAYLGEMEDEKTPTPDAAVDLEVVESIDLTTVQPPDALASELEPIASEPEAMVPEPESEPVAVEPEVVVPEPAKPRRKRAPAASPLHRCRGNRGNGSGALESTPEETNEEGFLPELNTCADEAFPFSS